MPTNVNDIIEKLPKKRREAVEKRAKKLIEDYKKRTWNNRIFKHKGKDYEYYMIHEVYYDENGKLDGWTEDAISPRGDTVEELIEHLEQLLKDAKRSKKDMLDYK